MALLGVRKTDDQQQQHYDNFGRIFREQILSSVDPSIWTADQDSAGPIFQCMRLRVQKQEELIDRFFSREHPVLDVGCGFGRQAYLMSRRRFRVVGVDTSNELIDIARCLFDQRGLTAVFHCGSVFEVPLGQRFRQAVIFDVLEHVVPESRARFVRSLLAGILEPSSVVIVTVPILRLNFVRRILNGIRLRIRPGGEHPYYSPTLSDIVRLFRPTYTVVKHEIDDSTRFLVLRRE